MENIRHFSYIEPSIDGSRKVGFTVGKPACKNQTKISSIEKEIHEWYIGIKIYVSDELNSETLWKEIMITQSNVSIIEYDWKKSIECKK